ncbi:MAG: SDR family NAD(P)-dependent oxidoreductase [Nitrosarchaeum sp.]|nr:SDR family NAD(P)-dependent oxidoreductase [Nitrosarchaeum sp.]
MLVTGATGFIGTNLLYRLLEYDYNISVIVHKKSNMNNIKNIAQKLDIHNVDLSKSNIIKNEIKKIKPNVVYHLATYGVNHNQTETDKIINTNIFATFNLFDALLDYPEINKIVNIGSCFEYGPKINKIKETSETNPQSVYGFSKVSQTNIAKYFYEQNKFPIVTLRIFNTYGPFENRNRLIPSMISSAINSKKIHINNPNDVRDFVFVKDVADGIIQASKIKKLGEILNIGTSKEYKVRDVVNKLSKITKYDNVVFDENKTHEYGGKIVADITKSKKILNWEPAYTLDEGLKETFEWFKTRNIRN